MISWVTKRALLYVFFRNCFGQSSMGLYSHTVHNCWRELSARNWYSRWDWAWHLSAHCLFYRFHRTDIACVMSHSLSLSQVTTLKWHKHWNVIWCQQDSSFFFRINDFNHLRLWYGNYGCGCGCELSLLPFLFLLQTISLMVRENVQLLTHLRVSFKLYRMKFMWNVKCNGNSFHKLCFMFVQTMCDLL